MPVPDIALEVTRAGRALMPLLTLGNAVLARRVPTVFAALADLDFVLFGWRRWYGSNDIIKRLADPEIIRDMYSAWDEMRQWEQSIEALHQERDALAAPYQLAGVALPPKVADLDRKFVRAVVRVTDRRDLAGEAHSRAGARAFEDVYRKLRDGRLVARGRMTAAPEDGEIIRIPARHWEVIRFNWDCCSGPFVFSDRVKFGDFTGASSDDLQYYGVEVARA